MFYFIDNLLVIIKSIKIKDIIYLSIIGYICWLLISQHKTYNNLQNTFNNNITALTDSVSYYKSKTGELVAHKTVFECNIKELEKLNDSLYAEIKDLKIKNDILHGTHINGTIENPSVDTVFIVKTDTISKGFKHNFNFNDIWRDLEGNVLYNRDSLKVNITKDVIKFDYTIVMDNKNNIYVNSSNPYVKYNEFSGFTVPKPKNKRFSIGPSIGIGYGIVHQKPDVFVGVNATWKLIEF